MKRLRALQKRWPATFSAVQLLIIVGLVLGLGALWEPGVWILLGCAVVALIVVSALQDRRARRR